MATANILDATGEIAAVIGADRPAPSYRQPREQLRGRSAAVVAAAGDRAIVKVILENAYLTDEEKRLGSRLAAAAGAHFVKTSTGYAPSGATVEDLRLMRAEVPPSVQVKAAGGVRTLDALIAVIEAGATRAGATATAAILDEFDRRAGSADSRQPLAVSGAVEREGY